MRSVREPGSAPTSSAMPSAASWPRTSSRTRCFAGSTCAEFILSLPEGARWHAPSRWRYVFDEETYPLGALDAIGLAASNAYGVTTVVNVDPRHGRRQSPRPQRPVGRRRGQPRVLIMDDERPEALEAVVAPPELSIADAISQLDVAGTGGLVLCRPDGQVAGLLTDGDLRRAVLRKVSLADPCDSIATPDPVVARAPIGPAEALQVMLQHDINHLPVVDESRQTGRLPAPQGPRRRRACGTSRP